MLWTAYLFRGKDEIFKTSILCKLITFVSSFMPQILYFHVFRRVPGKTLTFYEKKFGRKKFPQPPSPWSPDINMQYFPNTFILLGAQNVRVLFKHKKLVVHNILS